MHSSRRAPDHPTQAHQSAATLTALPDVAALLPIALPAARVLKDQAVAIRVDPITQIAPTATIAIPAVPTTPAAPITPVLTTPVVHAPTVGVAVASAVAVAAAEEAVAEVVIDKPFALMTSCSNLQKSK